MDRVSTFKNFDHSTERGLAVLSGGVAPSRDSTVARRTPDPHAVSVSSVVLRFLRVTDNTA